MTSMTGCMVEAHADCDMPKKNLSQLEVFDSEHTVPTARGLDIEREWSYS
jgi:hypothetical protein